MIDWTRCWPRWLVLVLCTVLYFGTNWCWEEARDIGDFSSQAIVSQDNYNDRQTQEAMERRSKESRSRMQIKVERSLVLVANDLRSPLLWLFGLIVCECGIVSHRRCKWRDGEREKAYKFSCRSRVRTKCTLLHSSRLTVHPIRDNERGLSANLHSNAKLEGACRRTQATCCHERGQFVRTNHWELEAGEHQFPGGRTGGRALKDPMLSLFCFDLLEKDSRTPLEARETRMCRFHGGLGGCQPVGLGTLSRVNAPTKNSMVK